MSGNQRTDTEKRHPEFGVEGKDYHVYDGIIEQDNPLPRWWLGGFIACILFGYAYWFYYQNGQFGLSLRGEWEAEQAAALKRAAETKPLTDDMLLALSQDLTVTKAGQQVYMTTCMPCHGDKGEGKVGPNLTDGFWIHGGTPTAIHKTIAEGSVQKGMPAWRAQLGAEKVRQTAAFVLTLKNKNVPGREPQGEPSP